jgi:hypothetical protein
MRPLADGSALMQSTLKSYNGWPASKDQAAIGIKSYSVPGTAIKLRCAEKVAPLLVGFAAEFHNLIEELDVGSLDDWGYAYRDVRGVVGKLSNHASGTAIDLNAGRHPLGQVGTFEPGKVPMIRALAHKYGLTWGGDYKSRKDEMHFEISIDAVKVAALINKLGITV